MRPIILLLILSCLSSFTSKAQQITCDAFCLTDVHLDTAAGNLLYVSLYFEGDENDFINYPYISDIISEQGDTIGHGTLNFFGQFGNTSNDYPVTIDFDSIPDNFYATMVFHYDTSVCLLSFPCFRDGIEHQNYDPSLIIYPNPASDYIEIANGSLIDVIELIGASGFYQRIDTKEGRVDIKEILPGYYTALLHDGNDEKVHVRSLVVVR